jgi:hypothetical protein
LLAQPLGDAGHGGIACGDRLAMGEDDHFVLLGAAGETGGKVEQ